MKRQFGNINDSKADVDVMLSFLKTKFVIVLMIIALSVMLIVFMVQATSETQPINSYLGLVYSGAKGFPEQLRWWATWAIGDAAPGKGHGVTLAQQEDQKMLWLEVDQSINDQGVLTRKVVDVLLLPTLKPNEMVAVGGQCYLKGKPDDELVAIGEKQFGEFLKNIGPVWRANRQTQKFEPIPNQDITCKNIYWEEE